MDPTPAVVTEINEEIEVLELMRGRLEQMRDAENRSPTARNLAVALTLVEQAEDRLYRALREHE